MYKQTLEFIKCHDLIRRGERVVAGLSGGADSVCLLLLLYEMKLRNDLPMELLAVHVHHGLRGEEADRDAEFARTLSVRLGISFTCVHVDAASYGKKHGMSEEEAGRILRYQALEQERRRWGAKKIAAAHHRDDQAETILYHLCRGTGLKGLGGMNPMRDGIIRPLLWASKKEILAYLAEKGEGYCEDSTNDDTGYKRNCLRHQVLPLLTGQVNERAVENMVHAGAMAAEADRYLEKAAGEFLKAHSRKSIHPRAIGIEARLLQEEDRVIQAYVVRQMIGTAAGSKKDITHVHVEQIVSLLEKPVGRRVDLPYGLCGYRTYDELWITEKKIGGFVDENPKEILPSLEISVFPYKKGQEIPKNGYTKWFDYDKINNTLSFRYRKAGDYITLQNGGRKTVKAFFIDEKVPKEERDRIPLVADGSHILWIVGYRVSEYYKITDETNMVLQIQRNGGNDNG